MTKYLTAQSVCARYDDISDRTLDRWVEAGGDPKADLYPRPPLLDI